MAAEIDRSTVGGGLIGGLSGVPLAPALSWFVKFKWDVDMPVMEVALPICVAGTAVVGVLQGLATHLIPSSPKNQWTNEDRRKAGLLPDISQPLSPEDIEKVKEVIGCGGKHGTV